MNIRCRPITTYPPQFQAPRRSSAFSAGWSQTMRLLESELARLGARNAVIELAVTESDLRLDGWPRAHARPTHPGVIISFDSIHGPLRYGTDAFPRWQENVRAIALGLEALRKVERYGIGKRGEQYVGWKALPAGVEDQTLRELGYRLIDEAGSVTAALQQHHPDRGGESENFRAVQLAREAIHEEAR